MTAPHLPATSSSRRRPASLAVLALAGATAVVLGLASAPASATRADREEPMSIDSDSAKGSIIDMKNHAAVFTGNVVIKQGTLVIHAAQLDVKEDADGRKVGVAQGGPGGLANFRQKSDRPDEWTEGEAQRIEYDSQANRVRFVGAAHLRVLRADQVTDEGRAAVISYDTQLETIEFDGRPAGTPQVAGAPGGGRTHVVFSPRQLHGTGGASAPGSTPAPAPQEPR